MRKVFQSLICVTLIFVIMSVLIIPASALQTGDTKYCPYCWVPLHVVSEYESFETVRKSCANTSMTGYVHNHYLYYIYEDCVCPECGYEVTVHGDLIKELCQVGNFSLRDE